MMVAKKKESCQKGAFLLLCCRCHGDASRPAVAMATVEKERASASQSELAPLSVLHNERWWQSRKHTDGPETRVYRRRSSEHAAPCWPRVSDCSYTHWVQRSASLSIGPITNREADCVREVSPNHHHQPPCEWWEAAAALGLEPPTLPVIGRAALPAEQLPAVLAVDLCGNCFD